ncbi:hypothetical protein GY45DRAFT_1214769, partial [Cubamyces sp. BRFM 1775]
SDWIQKEKSYPSFETPSVILTARRQVLAVPPNMLDMFPSLKLSVTSFLEMVLP